MAVTSGTYTVGPQNATLLIKTMREGAAARMGHDLTLEPERWSAMVVVDDADPSRSRVTATVDAGSLVVRAAHGGALPLIDRQRTEIADIIRDRVFKSSRHPEVTFASTAVAVDANAATMTGDLTVAGITRPVTLRLVALADAGHLTAAATVVQSAHGIKPYSAMLGALKVRDAVEIEVDVRLSEPG